MKDQWIDRYIAEVERHLSIKNSKDILDELRSTLSDALDDRASKDGRPADESMVLELLSEYGDPRKVAASYSQPNFLIGPDLLPTFWKVVKIVFTVISIVFPGALPAFAGHVSGFCPRGRDERAGNDLIWYPVFSPPSGSSPSSSI